MTSFTGTAHTFHLNFRYITVFPALVLHLNLAAPSLADRLPFGGDTLTSLFSHPSATCSTTLQAATLALLLPGLDITAAAAGTHNAGSSSSHFLLPAAASGRLVAAVAAKTLWVPLTQCGSGTPQEATAAQQAL